VGWSEEAAGGKIDSVKWAGPKTEQAEADRMIAVWCVTNV